MPVTVEDKGSGDCRPRKRLVSFQGRGLFRTHLATGAGTRGVRSELQKLHNGEDVVGHHKLRVLMSSTSEELVPKRLLAAQVVNVVDVSRPGLC